jgi:hypothetical protein
LQFGFKIGKIFSRNQIRENAKMIKNSNKPNGKSKRNRNRIILAIASIMLAFFAIISLILIGQSPQLFKWISAIWISAFVLLLLLIGIRNKKFYCRANWLKLQLWRVFSLMVILLTGIPLIPLVNAFAAPQESVLVVSESSSAQLDQQNNLAT